MYIKQFLFVAAFALFLFGCVKSDVTSDPSTTSIQTKSGDSEEDENSSDEEEQEFIEILDSDEFALAGKYCTWKITTVSNPNGRFQVGDIICFLCDNGFCDYPNPAIGGHRLNDGNNRYWGTQDDATCKVRPNCLARFRAF